MATKARVPAPIMAATALLALVLLMVVFARTASLTQSHAGGGYAGAKEGFGPRATTSGFGALAPASVFGSQTHYASDNKGKEGLVEKSLPWMSVQVRSLIASYLDPESTVMLEYGGGGSTMFFRERVKQLYTVESVQEFVDRLEAKLKVAGATNVQIAHRAPNGFYQKQGKPVPDLSRHRLAQEMARADVVNRESLNFWLMNGGPVGTKLPQPPPSLRARYSKFKGNWKYNSAYVAAPASFGVKRFDVVLIDGVARGACAFYVLDFIDQRSRVFIHDFYSARSPQQWTEKFNLEGLMRYYHIVGKIEELSPYVSGGLVVVLQKKTSAERREGAKLQRLSHRGDVYPMTI